MLPILKSIFYCFYLRHIHSTRLFLPAEVLRITEPEALVRELGILGGLDSQEPFPN
jgi:hypothetical protein